MFEVKPYERKVYYYETDRMGIVHHSNYIKWFEEARDDFMDQIGCPYDQLEDEGIMIPVLSVSSTYKKAFGYADTFAVSIIPKAFNGIKFMMEYEVRHKEENEIYAIGQSTHCFLDSNMRPMLLKKQKPELYALLDRYFMSNKISQKD
ncbi:MAG: acyl-CoA thioesterase [Lachnospiraceae bacterium]|nr:acyl-CoA thioesterase [Lachnospiraceae bacterium]